MEDNKMTPELVLDGIDDAVKEAEEVVAEEVTDDFADAVDAEAVETIEDVAEEIADARPTTSAAQAVADFTAPSAEVTITEPAEVQDPFALDQFSPEEQAQIDAFSQKIDLTNSQLVLQYGAGAQKNATDFCEAALKGMHPKDLGEMQTLLTNMSTEVKGFNSDEKKGLFGLFKKGEKTIDGMKAKYATIEKNMDKVEETLEAHQFELLKDIATLDKLYDQNKLYFKELSMYIAAGKKRLEEVRNNDLVALQKKAAETNLDEDIQAATDLASMCTRFEKKLHDLELTRMVTLQSAPQIRTVQDTNIRTSESIQSTITNTIPLWKRTMVMTIANAHSAEAEKAQQLVTDATNEMLTKNADMIHDAAVTSAEQYERGIVDMETIRHNNEVLINTIDEVLQIQMEGQEKRREAEKELQALENELKTKLLEASSIGNGPVADAD